MKLRGKFFMLLWMVGLIACDSNRIYEKNIDFSNRYWHVDSLATFRFQVPDPSREYQVLLTLRNTVAYPFQNIYIKYYLEDSLGNPLTSKLINQQLFNSKTGKPMGSGLGDIYSHEFPVLEGYDLKLAGLHVLKLEQYMRRDSLPEIVSVGIKVAKKEEE
ncbi:MAG: gliding motility lipoprotein GldH [Candidatus Cyclobacteriaceae bacterium M3_2C_046]